MKTVYIQGLYKAKILEDFGTSARCKVYEGLPYGEKIGSEYTYSKSLLKTKKAGDRPATRF